MFYKHQENLVIKSIFVFNNFNFLSRNKVTFLLLKRYTLLNPKIFDKQNNFKFLKK